MWNERAFTTPRSRLATVRESWHWGEEMRTFSRNRFALGVLSGGVLLAAPGLVRAQGSATPSAGAAVLDPELDLVVAQEIALQGYPGASVTSVALDRTDDALTYSIVLNTGVEVQVDATTGAVVSDRLLENATEKPTYVLAEGARLQSRATVSIGEAVVAAQGALPDAGSVRRIELEIEDGWLVDKIDFGRYEVYVDARTAAIVEIDRRSVFGR